MKKNFCSFSIIVDIWNNWPLYNIYIPLVLPSFLAPKSAIVQLLSLIFFWCKANSWS